MSDKAKKQLDMRVAASPGGYEKDLILLPGHRASAPRLDPSGAELIAGLVRAMRRRVLQDEAMKGAP